MAEEYFKLNSREEVQRFEELLHAYEKARHQTALEHVSLVSLFDALHGHPDGGRIFTLDLEVFSGELLPCSPADPDPIPWQDMVESRL
jgi:hypothetical protein